MSGVVKYILIYAILENINIEYKYWKLHNCYIVLMSKYKINHSSNQFVFKLTSASTIFFKQLFIRDINILN